jgi:hypothetical protein
MANLSIATGTFTLNGAWNTSLAEKLDAIALIWSKWHFNTCINGEFSKENRLEFNACGRWTYTINLENIDSWTREDLSETSKPTLEEYNQFLQEIEKNKLSIETEFTDVEPGDNVCYQATGTLSVSNGKLTYTEITCHNIPYTWELAGDGELEQFTCEVLKQLDSQSKEYDDPNFDKVYNWLKDHTEPNPYIEDLTPENWTELKKELTGQTSASNPPA